MTVISQGFGLHILWHLLPSFLQRSSAPLYTLTPTSYLDGLRGLAAFCVVIHHHVNRVFRHLLPSYGFPLAADGSGANSSLIQLPLLRLLYNGRPMVHIFFVISGYCLSSKPLKLIRNHEHASFFTTISSSIFRRGVRLYLPLLVAMLIAITLACMGMKPIAEKTLGARLAHGFYSLYLYCNFVDLSSMSIKSQQIEQHLWTIPVEMGWSMVLFVVLTGLSRVTPTVRITVLCSLMLYFYFYAAWAGVEFLLGMVLAELGLWQKVQADTAARTLIATSTKRDDEEKVLHRTTITVTTTTTTTTSTDLLRHEQYDGVAHVPRRWSLSYPLWPAFWWSNLVCGLWIFSWPDESSHEVWLWKTLAAWTPQVYAARGLYFTQAFWFVLAAAQIVTACQQLPMLQALLTTRVPQYLGKVSFGIYLMHLTVLDVFDPFIVPPVLYLCTGRTRPWTPYRPNGGKGGALGLVLSTALLSLPLLWVADLFYRFVDIKSVRLARHLELMALHETPGH